MNGTIPIPKYLEGIDLPDWYFKESDPLNPPPHFTIDYRGLIKYAKNIGKEVMELSRSELNMFCPIPIEEYYEMNR